MIHTLLDFLRTLTTPERLIEFLSTVVSGWWGYAMLTAIVFAETGLLVGFVLPGDSLLFTVGVVIGAGQLNLALILLLLSSACLLGDWCGYLLGRRAGPAIFKRKDSRFFKRKGYYLDCTDPGLATLPDGWNERLIPFRTPRTGGVTAGRPSLVKT